jgi:hypothetical protein
MRTITATIAVLAALFGSVFLAEAKGPFKAEVSGGDLTEPVTIEGPLAGDIIFENQALSAKAPEAERTSYTVKLMQSDPNSGEDFEIMMTYFPAAGDHPAVLRGDWDAGDRYFRASDEFRSVLDAAIGAAAPAVSENNDDGVSAVWYIAPSLAAVGLLLAGGLAGRRLLFRHD